MIDSVDDLYKEIYNRSVTVESFDKYVSENLEKLKGPDLVYLNLLEAAIAVDNKSIAMRILSNPALRSMYAFVYKKQESSCSKSSSKSSSKSKGNSLSPSYYEDRPNNKKVHFGTEFHIVKFVINKIMGVLIKQENKGKEGSNNLEQKLEEAIKWLEMILALPWRSYIEADYKKNSFEKEKFIRLFIKAITTVSSRYFNSQFNNGLFLSKYMDKMDFYQLAFYKYFVSRKSFFPYAINAIKETKRVFHAEPISFHELISMFWNGYIDDITSPGRARYFGDKHKSSDPMLDNLKQPFMRQYYLDVVDFVNDREKLYAILDQNRIATEDAKKAEDILKKYENDPLLLSKFNDNTNPLYHLIKHATQGVLDAQRKSLIEYILKNPKLKNNYLYDDNNCHKDNPEKNSESVCRSPFYLALSSAEVQELILKYPLNPDINAYDEKNGGTTHEKNYYNDAPTDFKNKLDDIRKEQDKLEKFAFSPAYHKIKEYLDQLDPSENHQVINEKHPEENHFPESGICSYSITSFEAIDYILSTQDLRELFCYKRNEKNSESGLYRIFKGVVGDKDKGGYRKKLKQLLEFPGLDFTAKEDQTPFGSLYDYAIYHQSEFLVKFIEVYMARHALFSPLDSREEKSKIIDARGKIYFHYRDQTYRYRADCSGYNSERIERILKICQDKPYLLVDPYTGMNPLHVAIESNLADVIRKILDNRTLRDFYCYDASCNQGSALYYLIDRILTKGDSTELPEYKLLQVFLNCKHIDFKKPGGGLYGSPYELINRGYSHTLRDLIEQYINNDYEKDPNTDSVKLLNASTIAAHVSTAVYCEINNINELIEAIKNSNNPQGVEEYLEKYKHLIAISFDQEGRTINPYLIAKKANNTIISEFIESNDKMKKTWSTSIDPGPKFFEHKSDSTSQTICSICLERYTESRPMMMFFPIRKDNLPIYHCCPEHLSQLTKHPLTDKNISNYNIQEVKTGAQNLQSPRL